MNPTTSDDTNLVPLNIPLVTVSGNDGRVRVWASQWCGLLCGPPPRLTVGLPARFATFAGKSRMDALGVSLPAEDLLVPSSLAALLSGADQALLAPAGVKPLAGPATGAPLLMPSPLRFECRQAELRLHAGQVLLSAAVAAIHTGERSYGPESWRDLWRLRPWDHLRIRRPEDGSSGLGKASVPCG